jgi:hypothetical protein
LEVFVYVEVTSAGVEIGEPDDCTALDVRLSGAGTAVLETALPATGIGTWDGGEHVELDLAELRRRAGLGQVGADWPQRWDAMVGYAGRKGWLSADGRTVRAHVVA